GWVALLPGRQSLTRSHFPCKALRRRPRSTSTPPAAMTSRPPRALYATALLTPVEARGPDVLLGVGWPTGAPIPACARVPIVPEAETTGVAAVGVGAGDGLSA